MCNTHLCAQIAHWIPEHDKWVECSISHLNYRRKKWAEYTINGKEVEYSHAFRMEDYGKLWCFIVEHEWSHAAAMFSGSDSESAVY